MPQYEYRCQGCRIRFSVNIRTYAEYDSVAPCCPECASSEASRIISNVSMPKSNRDYSKMSSGDMLSVLESGQLSQTNELFKQVGAADALSGSIAGDGPTEP